MEGSTDGMVAIVQGSQDAGLTVTVTGARQFDHGGNQRSNTESQREGLNRVKRSSSVQTGAGPQRARSSEQICSPYNAQHNSARMLAPSPALAPLSASNQHHKTELLPNLSSRGHNISEHRRPASTEHPTRIPARDVRPYTTPFWDDRGVFAARSSRGTNDSNAFAESLRKYPSGAERTSSDDLIQRLLAFTQSKHVSKNSNSVRSLRRPREVPQEAVPPRQSSKNVQTYTRARHSPGYDVSAVYGKVERRRRVVSPAKSDRGNLGSPSRHRESVSASYDYLKIGSPRFSPRATNVRYLSDVTKLVRDTLRQLCDDQPTVCPQIASRYHEHRRSHHRTDSSTETTKEIKDIITTSKTRATSVQPSCFAPSDSGSLNQSTDCIRHRSNRVIDQISGPDDEFRRSSKEIRFTGLCKEFVSKVCPGVDSIDEQCPCPDYVGDEIDVIVENWLVEVPVYATFSTKETVDRQQLICNLKTKLKKHLNDDVKCKTDIIECLGILPVWRPPNAQDHEMFKEDLSDSLLNRLKDELREIDLLNDVIRQWIDTLPLNFGIIDKCKHAADLTKKLHKVSALTNPENKLDILKDATLEELHKLSFNCNPLEKHRILPELAENLAVLLTDSLAKDEFSVLIRNWVSTIPLKTNPRMSKNKFAVELTKKFKQINSRTDADNKKDAIRDLIINELQKLPVDCDPSKKDGIITELAEILTTQLASVVEKDVIYQTIRDWVESVSLKSYPPPSVDKNKFARDLTIRLKDIVEKTDPAEVKNAIKDVIINELAKLPVDCPVSDKEKFLSDLADNLVNNIIKDQYFKIINDWLVSIPLKSNPPIDKKKLVTDLTKNIKNIAATTTNPKHTINKFSKAIHYEIKNMSLDCPSSEKNLLISELVDQLADKLFKEKYNDAIRNWLKNVSLKCEPDIDKNKFISELSNKLAEAVLTTENDKMKKVFKEIINAELKKWPLECDTASKSSILSDLVEDLAETLDWTSTGPFKLKPPAVKNTLSNNLSKKLRNIAIGTDQTNLQKGLNDDVLDELENYQVDADNLIKTGLENRLVDEIAKPSKPADKITSEINEEELNKTEKVAPTMLKSHPEYTKMTKDDIKKAFLELSDNRREKEARLTNDEMKTEMNNDLDDHIEVLKKESPKKYAINVTDWLKGIKSSITKQESENIVKKGLAKLRELRVEGANDEIVHAEIKRDIENQLDNIVQNKGSRLDPKMKKVLCSKLYARLFDTLNKGSKTSDPTDTLLYSPKPNSLTTSDGTTSPVSTSTSSDSKPYKKINSQYEVKKEIKNWIADISELASISSKENARIVGKLSKKIDKINSQDLDYKEARRKMQNEIADKLNRALSNLGKKMNVKSQKILANRLLDKLGEPIDSSSTTSSSDKTRTVNNEQVDWIKVIPELAPQTSSDVNSNEEGTNNLKNKSTYLQAKALDNKELKSKMKTAMIKKPNLTLDEKNKTVDLKTKNKLAEQLVNNLVEFTPSISDTSSNGKSKKNIEIMIKKDIKSWMENIPELDDKTAVEVKDINFLIENLTRYINDLQFQGFDDKITQRQMKEEIKDKLETILGNNGKNLNSKFKNELADKLVTSLVETIGRIESSTSTISSASTGELEKKKTPKVEQSETTYFFKGIQELEPSSSSEIRNDKKISRDLTKYLTKLQSRGFESSKLKEKMISEIKKRIDSDFRDKALNKKTKNKVADQLFNKLMHTVEKSEPLCTSSSDKLNKTVNTPTAINEEIKEWIEDIPGLSCQAVDFIKDNEKVIQALSKEIISLKTQGLYDNEIKKELQNKIKELLGEFSEVKGKDIDLEDELKLANKLIEKLKHVTSSVSFAAEPKRQPKLSMAFQADVKDWIKEIPELQAANTSERKKNKKLARDLAKKLTNLQVQDLGANEKNKEMVSEIKGKLLSAFKHKGGTLDLDSQNRLADKLIHKLEQSIKSLQGTAFVQTKEKSELSEAVEKEIEKWMKDIPELSATTTSEARENKETADKLAHIVTNFQSRNVPEKEIRKKIATEIKNNLDSALDAKGKKIDVNMKKKLADKLLTKLLDTMNRIGQSFVSKVDTDHSKTPSKLLQKNVLDWIENIPELKSFSAFEKNANKELSLALAKKLSDLEGNVVNERRKNKMLGEIRTDLDAALKTKGEYIDLKNRNILAEQLLNNIVSTLKMSLKEFTSLEPSNSSTKRGKETDISGMLGNSSEKIGLPTDNLNENEENILDAVVVPAQLKVNNRLIKKVDDLEQVPEIFEQEIRAKLKETLLDMPELLTSSFLDQQRTDEVSNKLAKTFKDLNINNLQEIEGTKQVLEKIKSQLKSTFDAKWELLGIKDKSRIADKLLERVLNVVKKTEKEALRNVISIGISKWLEETPALASQNVSEKKGNDETSIALAKKLNELNSKGCNEKKEQMLKEVKEQLEKIFETKGEDLHPIDKKILAEEFITNVMNNFSGTNIPRLPTCVHQLGDIKNVSEDAKELAPIPLDKYEIKKVNKKLSEDLTSFEVNNLSNNRGGETLLPSKKNKLDNSFEEIGVPTNNLNKSAEKILDAVVDTSQFNDNNPMSKTLVNAKTKEIHDHPAKDKLLDLITPKRYTDLEARKELTDRLIKNFSDEEQNPEVFEKVMKKELKNTFKEIPQLLSGSFLDEQQIDKFINKLAKSLENVQNNNFDEKEDTKVVLDKIKSRLKSTFDDEWEPLEARTKSQIAQKLLEKVIKVTNKTHKEALPNAIETGISKWLEQAPALASQNDTERKGNDEISQLLARKLSDLNCKGGSENTKNEQTEQFTSDFIDNSQDTGKPQLFTGASQFENVGMVSKNIAKKIKKIDTEELNHQKGKNKILSDIKSQLGAAFDKKGKKNSEKIKDEVAENVLNTAVDIIETAEEEFGQPKEFHRDISKWIESIPELACSNEAEKKENRIFTRLLAGKLTDIESKGGINAKNKMYSEILGNLESALKAKGKRISLQNKEKLVEKLLENVINTSEKTKKVENDLQDNITEFFDKLPELSDIDVSAKKNIGRISKELAKDLKLLEVDDLNHEQVRSKIILDIKDELENAFNESGKPLNTKTKNLIAEQLMGTVIESMDKAQKQVILPKIFEEDISSWIKTIPELVAVDTYWQNENEKTSKTLAKELADLQLKDIDDDNMKYQIMRIIKNTLNTALDTRGARLDQNAKNKLTAKLLRNITESANDKYTDKNLVERELKDQVKDWLSHIPELSFNTPEKIDDLAYNIAQELKTLAKVPDKERKKLQERAAMEQFEKYVTKNKINLSVIMKKKLVDKLLDDLNSFEIIPRENEELLEYKIEKAIIDWHENIPELSSGSTSIMYKLYIDTISKNLAEKIKELFRSSNDKAYVDRKIKQMIGDHLVSAFNKSGESLSNKTKEFLTENLLLSLSQLKQLTYLENQVIKNVKEWLNKIPELTVQTPSEFKDFERLCRKLAKEITELQSKGLSDNRNDTVINIRARIETYLDSKKINPKLKKKILDYFLGNVTNYFKKLDNNDNYLSQDFQKNVSTWLEDISEIEISSPLDRKENQKMSHELTTKLADYRLQEFNNPKVRKEMLEIIKNYIDSALDPKKEPMSSKDKNKLANQLFSSFATTSTASQKDLQGSLLWEWFSKMPSLTTGASHIDNIKIVDKLNNSLEKVQRKHVDDDFKKKEVKKVIANWLKTISSQRSINLDDKTKENIMESLMDLVQTSPKIYLYSSPNEEKLSSLLSSPNNIWKGYHPEESSSDKSSFKFKEKPKSTRIGNLENLRPLIIKESYSRMYGNDDTKRSIFGKCKSKAPVLKKTRKRKTLEVGIDKSNAHFKEKRPIVCYLEEYDNDHSKRRLSSLQSNFNIIPSESIKEISKEIDVQTQAKISALIAENIHLMNSPECKNIMLKILKILTEEAGLPDDEAANIVRTVVKKAQIRAMEISSDEIELLQLIKDEIKGFIEEYNIRKDKKAELESYLTDLVAEKLLDRQLTEESREAILENIQSKGDLSKEQAEDIFGRVLGQAARFMSSPAINKSLDRIKSTSQEKKPTRSLTLKEQTVFEKKARPIITDFLYEYVHDPSPYQQKKIKSIADDALVNLGDILVDSEINGEDKRRLMKNEIAKQLRRLSLLISDKSIIDLADELLERLEDINIKTSTPKKRDTEASVYSGTESVSEMNNSQPSPSVSSRQDSKRSSGSNSIERRKSGSEENKYIEKYMKKLEKVIGDWLDTLSLDPSTFKDIEFKTTIVKDLAGDIIDRQKYLQLNPDVKTTDADESDNLRYQCFRWMNKFLDDHDLNIAVDRVDKLLEAIKGVKIPPLVKPLDNEQETKLDKGEVPRYVDALQYEIISWIGGLPPHIEPIVNNDEVKGLIVRLANEIRQHNGEPGAVKEEIAKFMSQIYGNLDQNQLKKLDELLFYALEKKGFTGVTWLPIQDATKFIEEILHGAILDWLKQLPLHQSASPQEKIEQELTAAEMAKDLKRICDETKSNPVDHADELLRSKIIKHMRKCIKDPELYNDAEFMKLTAEQLLNHLKDQQFYKDLFSRSNLPLVDNLANSVDNWVTTLPIEPKTSKEKKGLEDAKKDLVTKIKLARKMYHPSSFEHELALKEGIKSFLTANLIDPFRKNNEKYLEEKTNELVMTLQCIPILQTSKTRMSTLSEKPIKNAKDTLHTYIEEWCENLTIEGDPEKTQLVKQNLAGKIMNKIGELNMNPDIFNDDILYEDLLLEEIDKLIEKIPKNEELNKYLPVLTKDLISKIIEARQILRDELAGKVYKQQLRDSISASMYVPENLSPDEQASFDLLKDKLADAFINLHYSLDSEDERVRYKNKISDEVDRFCENIFRRYPCLPIDPSRIKRDLHNALTRVPVPKDDSMKSEIEQARIRDIINQWMKGLSLRQETSSEKLHRNKLAAILAKQLHDIEVEKELNCVLEADPIMYEDIIKFLKKLPMVSNQKARMSEYTQKLISWLKNSEQSRKFESRHARSMETQADVCNRYPCTLTEEDQAHLSRIRERVSKRCYKDVAICPSSLMDSCSQTDNVGPSWMQQTFCPRVRRVASARRSCQITPKKDASCTTFIQSPCHMSPRVIVKEFVWDSAHTLSMPGRCSVGLQNEPQKVSQGVQSGPSHTPSPTSQPCPYTSSPAQATPRASSQSQAHHSCLYCPHHQEKEIPYASKAYDQKSCEPSSGEEVPNADCSRSFWRQPCTSSMDNMPPCSRAFRQPRIQKSKCEDFETSCSAGFPMIFPDAEFEDSCSRHRGRRIQPPFSRKKDRVRERSKCKCKERILVSCRGSKTDAQYHDMCQSCGSTCPHPSYMYFRR